VSYHKFKLYFLKILHRSTPFSTHENSSIIEKYRKNSIPVINKQVPIFLQAWIYRWNGDLSGDSLKNDPF
jgi:hypothetical protein